MNAVEEIKTAIDRLSFSQRAELERLLHGWTDDEWDRQIAQDAAAGRLDRALAEVDAEIDAGQLRDIS